MDGWISFTTSASIFHPLSETLQLQARLPKSPICSDGLLVHSFVISPPLRAGVRNVTAIITRKKLLYPQ